ncbi:hypothetical protein E3N88_39147 [Mikania micrantha]|uniref:GATA-type domain-containing protein n=1 Tax=Mikania micrantha TaxID=192012 RepID=A0A5N6LW61_9ASTR|nr:hypothetical protein E3N88_39147 [Mikania micrantha]
MPYDGESPVSSAVDCTLSLGTPATRLTGDYDRPYMNEGRSATNWSASFCWDILQSSPSQKTNVNGPVLARRCANCDTTSTPLWRNGPRGPKVGYKVTSKPRASSLMVTPLASPVGGHRFKSLPRRNRGPWEVRGFSGAVSSWGGGVSTEVMSLCNACGIRFKKEERRANAAASVAPCGGDTTEAHHYQPTMSGNPWVHHTQTAHKLPPCYSPSPATAKVSEFRFIDDVDDRDSPFLTWRFNVTDGADLGHGSVVGKIATIVDSYHGCCAVVQSEVWWDRRCPSPCGRESEPFPHV